MSCMDCCVSTWTAVILCKWILLFQLFTHVVTLCYPTRLVNSSKCEVLGNILTRTVINVGEVVKIGRAKIGTSSVCVYAVVLISRLLYILSHHVQSQWGDFRKSVWIYQEVNRIPSLSMATMADSTPASHSATVDMLVMNRGPPCVSMLVDWMVLK